MSTSAQLSPAWKQEVNRRLAEHRDRTRATTPETKAPAPPQRNPSPRAQEAAARVAARYANAPSYNGVLAGEARAVLRAAEVATLAARHAQAAAQSVLAEIEAAHASAPLFSPAPPTVRGAAVESRRQSAPLASPFADDFFARRPEPRETTRPQPIPGPDYDEAASAAAALPPAPQPISILWDEEPAMRSPDLVQMHATLGQDLSETDAEDWWRPAAGAPEYAEPQPAAPVEILEPVPIPANLIEFPRELVTRRKARPRLTESPQSAVPAPVQLSIFEVEPVAIAAEPMIEAAAAQPWTTPAWPGIELEPRPSPEPEPAVSEPAPQSLAAPVPKPLTAPASEPAAQAAFAPPALETAPASLRLLAMAVDSALVTGSLLAAALFAATHARALPGPRATEITMGVALFLAACSYETLFLTFCRVTPGMLYARIRLVTFEGLRPTRAERKRRLWALLVSVLPAGLGLAWSLFDRNRLSCHDRLSRTYLCKK